MIDVQDEQTLAIINSCFCWAKQRKKVNQKHLKRKTKRAQRKRQCKNNSIGHLNSDDDVPSIERTRGIVELVRNQREKELM